MEALIEDAILLMSAFNLLPNDALILAICQLHQIPAIASYDPDFITVCKNLSITLLQTVEDFNHFYQNL